VTARPSEVLLSAIGTYIPERRADNQVLLEGFGVDEHFLANKIGFRSRAVKSADEQTSDLCVRAFEDLCRHVPTLDVTSVEVLCVVTQNPDVRIPHTAAIVHHKLGLPQMCMTFDVSQGCAGYVHGLAIVMALAERLHLDHVLLFTADPYSTIVDPHDRNTALLFGDAATATYLSADPAGYRLVDATFGTAPGSSHVLHCHDHLTMDGRQVFLHAARQVPPSITGLLSRHDLSTRDIDQYLLHPGSKNVLDVLRRTLDLPEEHVPFEAEEYGNTVSSSIPLMLQRQLHADTPARRILISGFGVGFSWGTALLELNHATN
jgi:3-oxoacyl-[acyl-carrier-protein] synthase-3